MGCIKEGRPNERAERWDEEHSEELFRHARRAGMSIPEACLWAEEQNPHRKAKVPADHAPDLFGDASTAHEPRTTDPHP